MCPDDRVLSAFYDEQLPARQREDVRIHADGCTRCRRTIAGYGRISSFLASQELPDFSAGRERIREAVLNRPPAASPLALFSRKFSVPIPVAAAAVAALIVLFAGVGVLDDYGAAPGVIAAILPGSLTDVRDLREPEDLDQLLHALSAQNGLRELTIELPEVRGLSLRGEPRFLRETEMPGRDLP